MPSGHSWTAQLPQPGSNRGYRPEQLIEQLIFGIWCGVTRFAHADITRLNCSLVRLFDWGRGAGHNAVVGLFQRFDQASGTRVKASSYRWLFYKLQLNPITLDVNSTVLIRLGGQIVGGDKGYNPKHHAEPATTHYWRLLPTGDWWADRTAGTRHNGQVVVRQHVKRRCGAVVGKTLLTVK